MTKQKLKMSTGKIHEDMDGNELIFDMDDVITLKDELLFAIQKNDLDQVQRVYKKTDFFSIDVEMLWSACEEEIDLKILNFLLNNKKSNISHKDFNQVLLRTIKNEKVDQIEELIKSREVNIKTSIQDEKNGLLTFLEHAIKTGHRDTVLALFKAVTDSTGKTIQEASFKMYQAFLSEIKKIKSGRQKVFYDRLQNPIERVINLSGCAIASTLLDNILKFFMFALDGRYMASHETPHTLNLSGIDLSGSLEKAQLKKLLASNICIESFILNETGLKEAELLTMLNELDITAMAPRSCIRITMDGKYFQVGMDQNPSANISDHQDERRASPGPI